MRTALTISLLARLLFVAVLPNVEAFTLQQQQQHGTMAIQRHRFSTTLSYSDDKHHHAGAGASADDWQTLNQRLAKLRVDVLEKEVERPPNARLSACDFVEQLLSGILHNEDPLPESGFRLLLRTATDAWKHALYEAVGAPRTATEDVVASALGQAIGRPDNQYALLVGGQDNAREEEYVPTFPYEPLDYYDGTAWVECQLRDPRDGTLLVSTGWQLQRNEQGAWMVAGLDWQDFRDQYRPGIGREEWMRVCY